MPWWSWVLVSLVVIFFVIPLILGMFGPKYGNQSDFIESSRPFLDRSAEYRRIALEPSTEGAMLQKALSGLDWELNEYRKWALVSGVANTSAAMNGELIIRQYIAEIRGAHGLPESNPYMSQHSTMNMAAGHGMIDKRNALRSMEQANQRMNDLYDEALLECTGGPCRLSVLEEKLARASEVLQSAQGLLSDSAHSSDDLLFEFGSLEASYEELSKFVDDLRSPQ